MELRLDRLQKLASYTLGSLFIRADDGEWEWECFSKEPAVRSDGLFIAGESALPAGLYVVSLQPSKRFGRIVPLLAGPQLRGHGGAPMAMGMRFLPGHHLADSDSGILLGQRQGPRDVHLTKAAYEALYEKMELAIRDSRAIELEIV